MRRSHGASEPESCQITGCGRPAERSVSSKLAERAGMEFEESLRRIRLCKDHYRELKKKTRDLRELESLGR